MTSQRSLPWLVLGLSMGVLILAGPDIAGQAGQEEEGSSVRTDLHGDPLPPGATARLGTLRLREPEGLAAVAFSPDLDTVASTDGTRIRIWDAASGKVRRTLERAGAPIRSLAYSTDGRLLASGDDRGEILIWDLESRGDPRQVGRPDPAAAGKEPFQTAVLLLALSPDGRRIASANSSQGASLWDLSSGTKKFTLPDSDHLGGRPVFSPDGKTLALSRDSRILLYDPETGDMIREIRGHPADDGVQPGPDEEGDSPGRPIVGTIAYSPDGRSIASVGAMEGTTETRVHIWDAATGEERKEFETFGDDLYCVAFSPDGTRIAAAGQDFLHVWEDTSGKKLLEAHAPRISDLAFSHDGKTVAVASNRTNTIRLVDVATGKRIPEIAEHEGSLSLVVFSPDGESLATLDSDGRAIVWEAARGKPLFQQEPESARLRGVTFGTDSRAFLTYHADGTFRSRDFATGALLSEFNPYREQAERSEGQEGQLARDDLDERLTYFAIARDQETTAAATVSGVIVVGKLGVRTPTARLEGHRGGMEYMTFGDDGQRLLSWGADGTARVWELRTGKEIWKLEPHGETIATLGYTPGFERFALGDSDGSIHVWEMATGKEILERQAHKAGVRSIFFSPGGDRIISVGAAPSFDKTWSDRKRLANTPRCHVWDIATGIKVFSLNFEASLHPHPEEEGMASSVVITPDGRYLATGGRDRKVYLWEIASARPALVLQGHQGRVEDVAVSTDGKRLASASEDGTVLVWSLDPRRASEGEGLAGSDPLNALWASLGGDDALRAYEAVWRLAATGGKAVGHIEAHLETADREVPQQVVRLIADLSNDDFEVRERASTGLALLGWKAEPALRGVLQESTDPEERGRARALLEKLTGSGKGVPGMRLRWARAVQVLERIGTTEAQGLLESLARGSPYLVETREAQAALKRLEGR